MNRRKKEVIKNEIYDIYFFVKNKCTLCKRKYKA